MSRTEHAMRQFDLFNIFSLHWCKRLEAACIGIAVSHSKNSLRSHPSPAFSFWPAELSSIRDRRCRAGKIQPRIASHQTKALRKTRPMCFGIERHSKVAARKLDLKDGRKLARSGQKRGPRPDRVYSNPANPGRPTFLIVRSFPKNLIYAIESLSKNNMQLNDRIERFRNQSLKKFIRWQVWN